MCTESYGHCLALSFTSRLNVFIYVLVILGLISAFAPSLLQLNISLKICFRCFTVLFQNYRNATVAVYLSLSKRITFQFTFLFTRARSCPPCFVSLLVQQQHHGFCFCFQFSLIYCPAQHTSLFSPVSGLYSPFVCVYCIPVCV